MKDLAEMIAGQFDQPMHPNNSERATHLLQLQLANERPLCDACFKAVEEVINGLLIDNDDILKLRIARRLRAIADNPVSRKRHGVSGEMVMRADYWELAEHWLIRGRERIYYDSRCSHESGCMHQKSEDDSLCPFHYGKASEEEESK